MADIPSMGWVVTCRSLKGERGGGGGLGKQAWRTGVAAVVERVESDRSGPKIVQKEWLV